MPFGGAAASGFRDFEVGVLGCVFMIQSGIGKVQDFGATPVVVAI